MQKIKKYFLSFFLLFFFLFSYSYAQDKINYPVPTQYKYVNDYANILDSSTEQKIISLGHELYNKTKSEIIVVTMNKLPEGVDIETYSNNLFREWGIGDKKLNNGILFLINMDPQNRAMRIEVGYGLEGRVPDALAHRIQEESIIPFFKKNDYNTGVLNGYKELCYKVAQEYNVTLSGSSIRSNSQSTATRKSNSNVPIIIALLLFFGFDGFFLRFRILRFLLYLMLNMRFRGGGGFGGGSSGGGFGGYGGGSSGGGGSTGKW